MEVAINQAKVAKQYGEWPFGAAIFQGDRLIAQNRCTEAREKTVLAHAELQAVNDACKVLERNNLNDCVIYCSNEPCLMCAAAIFQARICRVVIGASRTDLPNLLRERQFRIEHLAEDSGFNPVITRGVSKDVVIALFLDIKKS